VTLAVVLVGTTAGIFLFVRYLSEVGPEDVEFNRFLIVLLSGAIVLLVLGLAGVLIRNLVRLIMDRKRGILGSGLRTKLVFFFLVLVLPPALVLFYGSATIIKMTVDKVLKTPVDDVAREAQAVVQAWTDDVQANVLREAGRIADRLGRQGIESRDGRAALQVLLEGWREREELDLVVVAHGAEVLARAQTERLDESVAEGARNLLAAALAEVGRDGKAVTRLDYLLDGLLVSAAAPVQGATGEDGSATMVGAVGVATYLPPGIAGRLERISRSTEAYRKFRNQRKELIALYLSLIALIFLVTVFGATWMGFYLSRRITDPVQELADATREIAGGNLDVRVRADVGDEVGTLVEAFNEMAAQLQESQEVITRSTAELRESNRAVEERRRYIETLLANLRTGVLSIDRDGRVTTVNPAVETLLGERIEAGDDARAKLDTSGLEPLRDLVMEATTGGAEGVRHDLALRRGGETLTVSVQVSRLRGRGAENLGTLVMVEDLTDLMRAQRAAAWQEVARRIAHEIKNPLTPIQLAAQRLRKKFQTNASDFGEIVSEATASIETQVGALKMLVDEFSRYARMPEVSPEPVDIRQVIDSAVALYRGHPGVRWEVRTDTGIGKVKVDPEQMQRVLINLIENALAAMGDSGTLRITTRSHAGPGSLRIEVSDTGPGIPPSDRDKMFVPYFSTKKRGTGLGLAIVHRVVSDHRGSIRVEDNEPRGARFVIEIPA
jgi:two-component system nitrogen regulation sensor histidine kinase NtrY